MATPNKQQMDALTRSFKEEAHDILVELESELLELNEIPEDSDLINRIFGSFHTLKGLCAMFEFDAIAGFTHEIETILDGVRTGALHVTPELVSITLSARDKIMQLLDDGCKTLDSDAQIIISQFQQFSEVDPSRADHPEPAEAKAAKTLYPVTYRIHFKPARDIFTTGTKPMYILADLHELGECTVSLHDQEIPALEEYDPESCYASWDIILTTDHDEEEIHDIFMFVKDTCEVSVKAVCEHYETDDAYDYKKIGEILLDRGDISQEELQNILTTQRKFGEKLVDSDLIPREKVDAALTEQEHVRKMLQRDRDKMITSIRVDTGRIDKLVDLVGELVTVQARLTSMASSNNNSELQMIAESVQMLTEDLRENAMFIRMVPVGALFSRVRRHVHDLSEELGKDVRLKIEGAATELDKTVVDQLNEPLVHIIRNAIHHGIELPETRRANNKPETAAVTLAARHEGASVVIEISDDGAGIDAVKVKTAAVKKGLIEENADLTREQCLALIFHPGFSMAMKTDNVSGRGVGMDVVKRSIEKLRGAVSIETAVNKGTTISLRIPLTLAIIDGLLVRIGHEKYIFPLSVVDECITLSRDEADRCIAKSLMKFRGDIYTYISLRDVLGVESELPGKEKVILVNLGAKKLGFSVDQVVGQHQTVIKSLSNLYDDVQGISGATILGDGTVALILDAGHLIHAGDRFRTPHPKTYMEFS